MSPRTTTGGRRHTVARDEGSIGPPPSSRFRPPGTVLGAPEIFTTVSSGKNPRNVIWGPKTSVEGHITAHVIFGAFGVIVRSCAP